MKINQWIMIMALCALAMPGARAEQLLKNPTFEEKTENNLPPYWFKAMIPSMTESLLAGVTTEGSRQILFMEQKGAAENLYNNWAQTIDNPPAGEGYLFITAVRGRNLTEPVRLIVVHFDEFNNPANDNAALILDEVSEVPAPEGEPIEGSGDWNFIVLAGEFPEGVKQSIARVGIGAGGEGRLEIGFAALFTGENNKEELEAWGKQAIERLGRAEKRIGRYDSERVSGSDAGLDLLVNGDFESAPAKQQPPGWFRAMIPERAIDMWADVGVYEQYPEHKNVAWIRQKGVKAPLVNNWAQRLETVPVGARVRLEADVMCRGVAEYKGVVMIQCWDMANNPDGELVAAATTQTTDPIGGTHDWRRVALELDVPESTDVIIVRCGLMDKGEIAFDNVSLKVVRPARGLEDELRAEPGPTSANTANRGFRVTATSLEQLERVRDLAAKFETEARAELGGGVQVRKEVFARGDGIYEMVISLRFAEEAEE